MQRNRRASAVCCLALGACLWLLAAGAALGSDTEPFPVVNAAAGLGLQGYDPVAYFRVGEARAGSPQLTQVWNGVTYRFVSEQHRASFARDPERWLPQYGGFCAFAMSLGRLADVDPRRFAIVGDRLFLNNNRAVHALWQLRTASLIEAADRNWERGSKEPIRR